MCSSSTQTAVTVPAHPACRKTVRGEKKNINHTQNNSQDNNPVAQQLWIGGTKLEGKKKRYVRNVGNTEMAEMSKNPPAAFFSIGRYFYI